MPLFCFILPSITPLLWNDTLWNGYFVAAILRYVFTLNMTWLVNSAAHLFGNKPYDRLVTKNYNISAFAKRAFCFSFSNRFINPAQNKTVAMMALGEGWHNYHHVFPWDYKTAELGNYRYNTTTAFIDFFAKIGWAYDLKMVSGDIVHKRVLRTGDGSHSVWGWGDKDQLPEDRDHTIHTHVKDQ